MPGSFRTLAGAGEASFVVRGSEFIGHAAPADDVAEAEAFVEAIRDRHPDATHNVPAYRVRVGDRAASSAADRTGGQRPRDDTSGSAMLREYQNDDGEPSGSAGKPVLNVLQGQDLENVAVVVTRYYGGTNLGVGGLVRAYSRATKDAVASAGTVESVPHRRVRVTVDYDDSGTVRGILESESERERASVQFDAAYEERVTFDVRVPVADADALVDRLRSATSGRAEVE
ncbi:IMPACT family protein [Halomarina pelagica]|uniref:IMPACT family protein n=1 Tax=Halomarina pelagica TaxID=2961599 RepID=UPI0020C27C5F|nr:YigZ family protein [Halomarina sp. BND7]